ncbi:hypothetical protein NDU88_001907 [Pleurodeles waltl]|uniref:Uncharacterized protein n=1 Tax=Pleurodeles waltl TaxID=8319 RepID=A0AAV7LZZ6_PLEWA|nr:hypothetical protein NDU88_001907 [Pleurodeles waltl]
MDEIIESELDYDEEDEESEEGEIPYWHGNGKIEEVVKNKGSEMNAKGLSKDHILQGVTGVSDNPERRRGVKRP